MIVFECVILFFLISTSHCRLPEKVFCVNQQCSAPISKAKTLINYNSGDPDLMSFRGNSEAIIFKKSADENPDIWYANINGKSGYVPSKFLREYKILQRNLEIILPVEQTPVTVQPNKVQQPHEVFEGTTIINSEPSPQETVAEVTTIPSDITPDPAPPVSGEQNQEPINNIDNKEQIPETNSETLNQNNINESLTKVVVDEQGPTSHETVPPSLPEEDYNKELNSDNELISNISNSDDLNDNGPEEVDPDPDQDSDSPDIEEALTSEDEENDQSEQNISSESNDNVSESVVSEVPQSVDINDINTEKPADQEIPPSNPINNDSELPKDNINNFQNPQAQKMHPEIPQVPDTKSETLASEPIVNNVIQNNINGEPIQENYQETPPPVSGTESTPQPTIPPLETGTNAQTIPAAFEYNNVPSEASNIPEDVNPIETTEESSSMELTQDTTQSYPSESLSESSPEHTDTTLDSMTTETIIEEIFSSTTEAPFADDSSEGLLSNIYTTVVDMLPPTTESPAVYNSDYVQEDIDKSFSFINYLLNTYHMVMGTREESSALFPTAGGTCYTDEYCDGEGNKPNRLLTFLLTTAGSVLLFTLGYYYIEGNRQDNRLIGNIDNLQRELLFTSKECKILKEELSATKTKLAGIEDSSFGMDDMVQSLKSEINELKENNERLRNSLDDNEKLLRVSENTAGELQNTLSEVENTLSELFAERAHSEEQISELNGKIEAFEEELISVSRERDNFQLKYVSAETALEEFKKQKKQLDEIKQTLSEAHNTIELQRHEIVALKDAVKELKGGSSSTDVKSLIDITEMKAKLSKALEEKNTYMTKYEAEHKERSRLSKELEATVESYKTSSQRATEAATRLEVLGKYFQEREGELMKELSTKEALWLSKQGESTSTVEKIELMQQEVQRHKERCDVLTRELAEQESSSRQSIAALESRAHEAWLEARDARRDLDAARADCATLRRKLASVSEGHTDAQRALSSPLESEMLPALPLPPLPFLPPLLPPLQRPPPVGRISSPQRYNEHRYSPASYYTDRRYSPDRRHSPERYSPETVRYSPDSRYSPRSRRSYSPRRRSGDRYNARDFRTMNGPGDTETEYNSDSPTRRHSRRRRYSRTSDPSSGSSESEK